MICGHCDHKHCSRCKQFKREDDFANNVQAKDGKQRWCRACVHAYHTERKVAEWLEQCNA